MENKICARCRVEKPVEAFIRIKQGKYLDSYCRQCKGELSKAWARDAKNEDKVRATKRREYEKNRHRSEFWEKVQAQREKERGDPAFRARRAEYQRSQYLKRRNEDLAGYREKQAQYAQVYRRRLRMRALLHCGGRCLCCGETILDFLTFDHIHGNGRKEYRAIRSSLSFLRSLLGGKRDDIRVLCWNCNLGRERHDGVCPHELIRQGKLKPEDASPQLSLIN